MNTIRLSKGGLDPNLAFLFPEIQLFFILPFKRKMIILALAILNSKFVLSILSLMV